MKRVLLLVILIFAAFSVTNAQLASFSGSLSTPDGVNATGYWSTGFMISWNVEMQENHSWLYSYEFTDLQGNALTGMPSHLTLEISPNTTTNDFWGFSGNVIEFGDKDGIESAMKLDWASNSYSFYSNRSPVWGDFFTKDGEAGGLGFNTAYNAGFGTDDPLAAATNGSIGNKILRPDTNVVPEPSTLLLMGLGLAGYGIRKRFRK